MKVSESAPVRRELRREIAALGEGRGGELVKRSDKKTGVEICTEMLASIFLRRSYWLDIRPATVVLLFLLHSFLVYECAMRGHEENGAEMLASASQLTELMNNAVPVGPMYSIRVHFLHHCLKDGCTRDNEFLARDVAPADVLILVFPPNMTLNRAEVVQHFVLLRRWLWITPLNFSSFEVDGSSSYALPERRLSFAESGNVPVPVILRFRNMSAFLQAESSPLKVYPASNGASIAACFLIETDPSHIRTSSGGTLQDELAANPNASRILAMAVNWGFAHNANWTLFISPCGSNQVYKWDRRHSYSLENTIVWWVCAASDTFIEVNAAASLITAVT
ncbi:hypothetical protein TraAM80_01885 [Trypanosoma rangeli]|uniref:Uncharacterized protein n=1 Tax=Trypanosoma rangeli TaxID=5698 RepID=A0A422NWK9_TRYRA|nr:uncharacterized protein TraAM80_01885 [Trypanosoma rangeli]RNF09860.1 hypothetical protein TraAM80_01885 [Trypanosoma rangeli]|eukprot:RNF09860.1 hypothetical protein TraAM80_01885 [Trypanosoma rangeli]